MTAHHRRTVLPLLVALATALGALLAFGAGKASATKRMKVGFYDEAVTLGYPDDFGFRTLEDLGADIVRMNLYWYKVAKHRPKHPANPRDPAYDWSEYDVALERARKHGIHVLLSIFGTPRWANGHKRYQYAPKKLRDLQRFATAAAKRYPRVRDWMAWNEPNAPTFLRPQSVKRHGRWVFRSPEIYAGICNAVVRGVNKAHRRDKIACGAFNPRGKRRANGRRDSVAPVLFLERMKKAGAKPEVISHHPYSPTRFISPTKRIKSKNTVTLGNLNVLIKAINRTYGKRMRLWITEYGYQTNPPDRRFGVSWKKQARWMKIAFARMRKNPRIDIALWFQIKDDSKLSGWQSGVISTHNVRKPSYNTFKRLAHHGR